MGSASFRETFCDGSRIPRPGGFVKGVEQRFFRPFPASGKRKSPLPLKGERAEKYRKNIFYSRARVRRRKIHPVMVTAERRVVRTMIPLARTASLPICLAMI